MRLAAPALALALAAACSSSPPVPGGSRASSATPTAPAVARTPHVVARVAAQLAAGRSRCVAVVDGSRIVVAGGLVAGDVTTGSIVSFDPTSRRSAPAGALQTPVHDASGGWLAGHVVVFGGGAATEQSGVQMLSGGSSATVGRLPQPRSDTAAVVVGRTAYVVGGYDGSALPSAVLATTDGRHFRVVAHLRQPVRYPAVTAYGGALWVAGGDLAASTSSAGGAQTRDVQRVDPRTGAVGVVARLPHPLGHAVAFVLAGRLYVAGGRSGATAQRTIWQVGPGGAVSRAGRLPHAVSDSCVAVDRGTAWLFGGETAGPLAPVRSVVAVRLSG